ncbi:uncharacterized protein LOC144701237 [Wolffia australiana]
MGRMNCKFVALDLFLYTLLLGYSLGIESPQFSVIHSESDFELRFYRESAWTSAASAAMSFEMATRDGFHRLFQYIQGANINNSRIAMTAPVLTSILPRAGPLHSFAYVVRFYLPKKFQAAPPVPLPELDLHSETWPGRCVAVRRFSGFARDSNVATEAAALSASLAKTPWANATASGGGANGYSIAQYNSPFRIIGRVNEVWFEIDGSSAGCSDAPNLSSS